MRNFILCATLALVSHLATAANIPETAKITLVNKLPYSLTFLDKKNANAIPQLDGQDITVLPNSKVTVLLTKEDIPTYITALPTYEPFSGKEKTAYFEANQPS